jgi:hypothetical protein
MSQPGDDAQRDLEQRALRNVRGLLDKLEDEERVDRRKTVRIAIACAIVVIVALGLIVAFAAGRKPPPADAIVIPPPANAAR